MHSGPIHTHAALTIQQRKKREVTIGNVSLVQPNSPASITSHNLFSSFFYPHPLTNRYVKYISIYIWTGLDWIYKVYCKSYMAYSLDPAMEWTHALTLPWKKWIHPRYVFCGMVNYWIIMTDGFPWKEWTHVPHPTMEQMLLSLTCSTFINMTPCSQGKKLGRCNHTGCSRSGLMYLKLACCPEAVAHCDGTNFNSWKYSTSLDHD